jgi:hypothetical protein
MKRQLYSIHDSILIDFLSNDKLIIEDNKIMKSKDFNEVK